MTHCTIVPQPISFETIDNETIVINLETGYYYCLEGTASDIWNLLLEGFTVDTVIEHYTSACADIVREKEITDFLNSLSKEGLIEFHDKVSAEIKSVHSFELRDYNRPAFQKFDDMEDLLLLDPIHEADESGWPHKLSEASVQK